MNLNGTALAWSWERLTSTLVGACFLIWATLSPDELSTQDRAPYNMETGMDGGSR